MKGKPNGTLSKTANEQVTTGSYLVVIKDDPESIEAATKMFERYRVGSKGTAPKE